MDHAFRPLDSPKFVRRWMGFGLVSLSLLLPWCGLATPVNRAALGQHYDRFLARNLNQCVTCHRPSAKENPTSLDEFPHNPFGDQLRRAQAGPLHSSGPIDLPTRLEAVALLDADNDGVANQAEILLGHAPGNPDDVPSAAELESLPERQKEFARFQASYRWRPFETVERPDVPRVRNRRWARNPIDAFIAMGQEEKGLVPRPEARRETLLRRVYLDLIGLSPTLEEQQAFLADTSPHAYEAVVDRLLKDPRHGERWGRHWMDIWRYSDWAGWTDGNQVRDSKPHIWRWRDWIVEAVNGDKGYDRMVLEMLAADEWAPQDGEALRATGFLVRNYKMLSREQWMEDTVKHTAQAFLGVTLGCAKCHDHMTDPISQAEYYRVRAIFEPHQVRTDRLPGELDTAKAGLVRVFDTATNRVTPLLMRGDERHPDTNRLMTAGVPLALCGRTALARSKGSLEVSAVKLPFETAQPDHRAFVRQDLIKASEGAVAEAAKALAKAEINAALSADQREEFQLARTLAGARLESLQAVLRAEILEDEGQRDTHEWDLAAMSAGERQREVAVLEARQNWRKAESGLAAAKRAVDQSGPPATTNQTDKATKQAEKAAKDLEAAQKRLKETESVLAAAEKASKAPPTASYQPRSAEAYPGVSTGRRLAFARWIIDPNNPLTARVAMNHLWLRHFGRGIVATPVDFGRSGRPPSHPQLLDWLAAEFMAQGWSMKAMHRLMVTSSTYRMASTSDEECARRDPDNIQLWRMPSRRLEAEAIRDNLLFVTGDLDLTMGGPEIDHQLGLTSRRRSLYLRLAAEKEVEFLRIFDGPTVTECYERRPSVVPQQALALGNSEIAIRQAEHLASRLVGVTSDEDFIQQAYRTILARNPKPDEIGLCRSFLTESVPGTQAESSTRSPAAEAKSVKGTQATRDPRQRRRENLVLVLLNHNDFVTIR